MHIIADSGGTKTDWAQTGNPIWRAETGGLHPGILSDEMLLAALEESEKLEEIRDQVTTLSFFGAGCGSKPMAVRVQAVLARYFSQAKIELHHDIYGAALALCHDQPGIAAILGTGSNAARFDGQRLTKQATSLGYLLGDEGGGYSIGREFLKAFCYDELPSNIALAFEQNYDIGRPELIAQLYRHPTPNRYIASFLPFIRKWSSDDRIKQILMDQFSAFLKRHILPLQEDGALPVHFCGGVAWHFRDILLECLQAHRLTPGSVIDRPIEALSAILAK